MDDLVAISAARDRLSDLIDDVRTMGRRIGLTRHGKTVAVLVTVEDAEAIAVAEDALDKAAAAAALSGYMAQPVLHPVAEVFGAEMPGAVAGFTPVARSQVAAMPGMTVATLMELTQSLAMGEESGARRIAEDIFSIRSDGCRLVYAAIGDKRLVLCVAG